METIVKHEDGSRNISAFAFGVGQTLDNMVNIRNKEILKENEILKAKIFEFRRLLEQSSEGLPTMVKILDLYDKNFNIR